MPVCTKCKVEKTEDAFHTRKDNKTKRRSHCKECTNTRNLSRYHTYEEVKASHHKASRKHSLRVKYGITLEDYDTMLELQGGGCYICGLMESSPKIKFLSVDHNHVTGRVRKLLCNGCNTALGGVREDTEILRKMIAYIEEHQESVVICNGLRD